MTLPNRAICPTPCERSEDGRHIADLHGQIAVTVDEFPYPLCEGCGLVLCDHPHWPQYWVARDVEFLIFEEPL